MGILFFCSCRKLTVEVVHREALNTSETHPPVPTASFDPLPTQFNDIQQSYQKCWASFYESSFTSNFLQSEFLKSSSRLETTFRPPRTGIRTYEYDKTTDCSTTTIGETVLCDNLPRASKRDIQCRTVVGTGTISYVEYISVITEYTPTWTSSFQKPEPTCSVAPDLSPECDRMVEAWRWRTDQLNSSSIASSERWTTARMMIPDCTPLVPPATPYPKPLCRIRAVSYSAYYWPTPTPKGEDFCNATWIAPTATPTISGVPNTVVIQGHTFTSPSVYHVLGGVKVETYRGQASSPDDIGPLPVDVWGISTAVPTALIVSQLEKEVLSASKKCMGREQDYCTIFHDSGFRIQDVYTVRAEAYSKNCGSWRCTTDDMLYQSRYQATLGIPVSEIQKQNGGMWEDCEWILWDRILENGWYSTTQSSIPAVYVPDIQQTAFVPVTKTRDGKISIQTGVSVPRMRRGIASPTDMA